VRAGVVEVFALEPDLRAAPLPGQPLGVIQRRRPADVVAQVVVELVDELRIVLEPCVRVRERAQRLHQRLGHELAAVRAEMSASVRQVVFHERCVARSAARTASTKSRIFAESFTPGFSSMPLDTSTAAGCSRAMPSPTFAAFNPPASTIGLSMGATALQSNA